MKINRRELLRLSVGALGCAVSSVVPPVFGYTGPALSVKAPAAIRCWQRDNLDLSFLLTKAEKIEFEWPTAIEMGTCTTTVHVAPTAIRHSALADLKRTGCFASGVLSQQPVPGSMIVRLRQPLLSADLVVKDQYRIKMCYEVASIKVADRLLATEWIKSEHTIQTVVQQQHPERSRADICFMARTRFDSSSRMLDIEINTGHPFPPDTYAIVDYEVAGGSAGTENRHALSCREPAFCESSVDNV